MVDGKEKNLVLCRPRKKIDSHQRAVLQVEGSLRILVDFFAECRQVNISPIVNGQRHRPVTTDLLNEAIRLLAESCAQGWMAVHQSLKRSTQRGQINRRANAG